MFVVGVAVKGGGGIFRFESCQTEAKIARLASQNLPNPTLNFGVCVTDNPPGSLQFVGRDSIFLPLFLRKYQKARICIN